VPRRIHRRSARVGYAEEALGGRYNAAICVSGDGVLGHHRKVHQPAGESLAYLAGDAFAAFDTPVGRLGMLIDYDKTFPESARALALDGAQIIAALSAWPASVTDRASRLPADRQSRLFDLYDCARAAENQVVVVSSNQTGVMGTLRFLGQAKVVGPGGDVLANTGSKGGLAKVTVDVDAEITRARKVLNHLAERRVDVYATRTGS
jgi:predicted amidohydrolase